jgi:serine/threonine-protein kinase
MNDAARELVGRTLGGRYRITGFLGEGAMAAVYRAEQDADPQDVAVKVAHAQLLRDPSFAKRFLREAKAASRVVHRNTVRILEHGADGEHLFLAMERLVGQDLFDTLARERRLPEARAARIVIQVCAGLEAAHAHGIVHRDLKPENVFLTKDPEDPEVDFVKVLDFGIAKILERERSADQAPPSSGPTSAPPSSSVLTHIGMIVGTPEYMSPEQGTGLPVDARSDVYACGVLLFHMITGRQPFTGDTPVDVLVQLTNKPPPAPSALAAGIHPGLEKLILQTLAKRPEERPQSAAALREALEALLPELATGSRRVPAASPSGSRIAGLPGVPTEVTIATEPPSRRRVEAEEAPATLRSMAGDEGDDGAEAETRTTTAVSAGARPTAEMTASAGAETSARTEAVASASGATGPTAETEDEGEGHEAPRSAMRPIRKAGEPDAALFGATAKSGGMVPPWVIAMAVAAIVALLWSLVRGMR